MILKHRDKELFRFEWVEPQGVHIVSMNEKERRFLPFDFKGEATDENLWKWLSCRAISRNRRNIEALMAATGLDSRNVRGIIEICRGLLLNDVHWVVADDFKGKWKDVNIEEDGSYAVSEDFDWFVYPFGE